MTSKKTNIKTEETVLEQEPNQAFASVNEAQQSYLNLLYPNGLSVFTDFINLKDYKSQVKKAKELRNYSIAKRLIRIRKDYTLPIKGFQCKAKRQQKFYNEIVLPLIKRIARQFIEEKWSIGEVFGHYGFKSDKKTPMYFRLEDPESIEPINALGFEIYKIKLASELKKQIKELQDKKAIDRLPIYLQKAISSDGSIQDRVVLTKENMCRSCADKLDYEDRVKPPILDILKQLALREFLLDLDRMNSFGSQKTSIVHTKCGSAEKPIMDENIIKKIHNLITTRSYGQVFLTTRGDVSVEVVTNKLTELLDSKRYEQCNIDILDYFGIPAAFSNNKSDSNNNNTVVTVSLKPFEQSIYADREAFEEFIGVFFDEINRLNGYNERPKILYKYVNIRDHNELLKELQFLKDSGVLSFEDICLKFDFDKDEQLEKKRFDWDNRDIEAPVVELSQGTSPMLQLKFDQEMALKNKGNNIQT